MLFLILISISLTISILTKNKLTTFTAYMNNSQYPLKVSIITVCLNSERFICNAIDSVLGQKYNNIEYIVKDCLKLVEDTQSEKGVSKIRKEEQEKE